MERVKATASVDAPAPRMLRAKHSPSSGKLRFVQDLRTCSNAAADGFHAAVAVMLSLFDSAECVACTHCTQNPTSTTGKAMRSRNERTLRPDTDEFYSKFMRRSGLCSWRTYLAQPCAASSFVICLAMALAMRFASPSAFCFISVAPDAATAISGAAPAPAVSAAPGLRELFEVA